MRLTLDLYHHDSHFGHYGTWDSGQPTYSLVGVHYFLSYNVMGHEGNRTFKSLTVVTGYIVYQGM